MQIPAPPAPQVAIDWNAVNQAGQNATQAQIEFQQKLADLDVLSQAAYQTYSLATAQADQDHSTAIAAAGSEYDSALQAIDSVRRNKDRHNT